MRFFILACTLLLAFLSPIKPTNGDFAHMGSNGIAIFETRSRISRSRGAANVNAKNRKKNTHVRGSLQKKFRTNICTSVSCNIGTYYSCESCAYVYRKCELEPQFSDPVCAASWGEHYFNTASASSMLDMHKLVCGNKNRYEFFWKVDRDFISMYENGKQWDACLNSVHDAIPYPWPEAN